MSDPPENRENHSPQPHQEIEPRSGPPATHPPDGSGQNEKRPDSIGEVLTVEPTSLRPTKSEVTQIEDTARFYITKGLLLGLLLFIGIVILRLIIWKLPTLPNETLDFVKWAVSILASLFGTAMGFYFGGRNKKGD